MKNLLLTLALTACGGWSNRDSLAELAFAGATTIDGMESIKIGRACAETNPLVGRCGERLNTYIPASVVAHALVSGLLPAGPWRRGWQLLSLGAEASVAWENNAIGWKP